MPRHFVPKRSGRHRIACIALYRALLSQCSRIELPSERLRGLINPIKHLIRRQFHRNQHVESKSLVVAALKVGYEAEELLYEAGNGDEHAVSRVLSLLQEVNSKGDAHRARIALNPPTPKPPFRKPEPYPNAPNALESRPRPLSELNGPRHVPTLTVANGQPFLIFKKPQSPFLSRVLRNMADQRQKWLNHVLKIKTDMDWAKDEDEWDRIINGGKRTPKAATFLEELNIAKEEPESRNLAATMKASKLGKEMLDVVLKEKRLFEEERIQRKRARRERWEGKERAEKTENARSTMNSNEPHA